MFSGDGSSTDPMFSGVSLQSLLSMNPSLFGDGYPTLASLTDNPNPNPNPSPSPKPQHQQQQSPNLLLLLPKTEQPYNFLQRLPELQCADEKPEAKRQRSGGAVVIPQSNLARQRRQKLSEKTRCLQKLMPWDKKMDQATLLEEAHKYVKFLQAQFRVLESMPSHTCAFLLPPLENGGVFGDLEKLNRNQLLQVLVNSPVAQTMLYSQGFCVFSLEQLSLLRKLSQTRQQQQQQVHVADPACSKTFFNSFIQ